MDPNTLAERRHTVQVVDVRHPNEWEAGRIEGAVHIPADYLAERVDELDRDRPVVTVCRSGARSEQASKWLRGEGFHAENLDGGMLAWVEEGLPVSAAGGAAGTVVDPVPPPDDRPPEMQQLQAGFLDVVFAVQERFGDRQLSEEEVRGFLRERLLAEGEAPEEADRFLTEMDQGPS